MTDVPVPPQYTQQPLVDFRFQEAGPRGYKVGVSKYGKEGKKRKLDEYEAQVEEEQAQMDEQQEPVQIGKVKRPKLDTTGVGKVSGRAWKQPAPRAGTLRNPNLSVSWEKKMQQKAVDKAYKESKKAAVEAQKEAKREARQRREAAKARKEEAQRRSELATAQKISNPATLKKMMKSKKLRKTLRTADTSA